MPTPIIELQRRLALVGAIRVGGEKQPKAPGRKLESFRLTSPRKQLLEQASGLYGGGRPSAWKGPNGDEWQLYTDAPVLPVLVMPHYSLRQTYELWEGATQRLRMCDGMDEELSGGPCICNAEGIDRCDIYTRLVVALPELDTVLGWRLITRGANAAHELPTMMQFVATVGGGAPFVPARLVLDQRRGIKEGQVVRYVVPTLDLDVGYGNLAAGGAAHRRLPPSPQPGNGAQLQGASPSPAVAVTGVLERPAVPEPSPAAAASMADARSALDAVTGAQTSSMPGGARAAAPVVTPAFDPAPMPQAPADDLAPDPDAGTYTEERQTKLRTEAQYDKLNVLVGQLRDRGGHITTAGLWLAIAQNLRECDVGELVKRLGGRDENDVLHWSPLRDDLTRAEASWLIDKLVEKQNAVNAAAG